MDKVVSFWDNLKNAVSQYLPNLVSALIIAAIGILIAFITVRVTRAAMKKKEADPSLISFVCKAERILIYVFALFAALSALGISITGLVAFFSAAAAAIALALKDRLNDVASGIVILFTKPFVTGDFIEFDNYQGFVQKIDIMHTDIMTYSRTNVIIPNSVISSSKVNNHTAEPVVRVQVDVPIPYEADVKGVKEILYQVLQDTDKIVRDDTHKDAVNLEKFGESALEFSVRCFCNFEDYWPVYYAVTQNVKEALDKNGVAIPFNQLDVHVIKNAAEAET